VVLLTAGFEEPEGQQEAVIFASCLSALIILRFAISNFKISGTFLVMRQT